MLEFVHGGRPGAHEAHIANQDIVELGQLVQAGLAEESSHFGHTGIVFHLEHGAVHLILRHQLFLAFLRVRGHGAEFVQIEIASVLTHTFLREKYRPFGIQLDGEGDKGRQHGGDGQAHEGTGDVHHPLDEKPAVVEGAGFVGEHRKAREGFRRLVGDDIVEIIDVYMDGDALAFEFDDELFDLASRIIRKMDEDLVDDLDLQLLVEVVASGDDGDAAHRLVGSFLFLVQQRDAGHLETPFRGGGEPAQDLLRVIRHRDDVHLITAGTSSVYPGKILLHQQMSDISQDDVIKEEKYKYQARKIVRYLGDEQKEAQDQDQHHVVFEYGDELDIIAPLENIDIPVKQVVGQQMEEQDVGDGHHVASGEGAPADLHSTGKNCQSKGQYDAEAFHCHQCIILNKPLFLTDIRHAFKSLL